MSLNLLSTQRICGYRFENLKIVSPRVNSHSDVGLSHVLHVTASRPASLWTRKRKGESSSLVQTLLEVRKRLGSEEKGGPGRSSEARPSP